MQPFQRLEVQYVVTGGTRVSWEMDRHFIDPGPYNFQLQVAHVGIEFADDWEDVGVVVTDQFFSIDMTQRLFGKTSEVHYRVRLNTPNGTYYSMTANALGLLNKRDWLKWREIHRKEKLRHRVLTSVEGFLLKARRYGEPCPICTDKLTEEITWTNCPTCYGTGFRNGYYAPLAASYGDIGQPADQDRRDDKHAMLNPVVITARFIADPQIYTYDIWCDKYSDKRYYIKTVKVAAQVRNVPVVYETELSLAPFTDVIYTYPLSTAQLQMQKRRLVQPLTNEQNQTECPPTQTKTPRPRQNYLDAALQELKERRNRSSRP
jgi:hypothetical protein